MNVEPNITLTITDLSIGYRNNGNTKTVCEGLNAFLSKGSITCLVGVNGAGKSTLLRTISGFIKPLHGDVLFGNRHISELSDKQLARIVGVVLTDRIDVQQFTVHDLVALGRSPYTGFFDRLSDEDNRIINEAIEMVGISELTTRSIETLSDGERQKVMIAKVLAQQTPYIFLDEPTAFLDYPSKVETMKLLHHLAHKMDKTILLSTHDLETSLTVTDNIWLLDRKKKLKTGVAGDFEIKSPITSEQILKLFTN